MGPGVPELPRPQGGVVGGRDRLDPLLPQPLRPPLHEPALAAATTSATSCRATSSASTRWPATSPTRRAEDPRRHRHRHHRLGVRLPPLRLASGPTPPSSCWPSWRRPGAPTRRSTRSRGRTPAGSSAGTRSSTCRATEATVGALRAKGADVDTTIRSRQEWAQLYEEKQLTKA